MLAFISDHKSLTIFDLNRANDLYTENAWIQNTINERIRNILKKDNNLEYMLSDV